MLTFKALHILSMFSVVTMEIAAEFLFVYTISRRDVRGLATVHRILERIRLGPISIAVFIAGIVFGLLTALTGSFDFLAGWLIAAYLLVATIFVGRGCSGRECCYRSASRRSRQTKGSVRERMSSVNWRPVMPFGSTS